MAGTSPFDREPGGRPRLTNGPGTALAFSLYAAIVWLPCVAVGVLAGAAMGVPPAEDGVVRGRTLGLSAALPEILSFTIALLVLAYAGPVLYLNRKTTEKTG